MTLSRKLKSIRENRRLTQEDAAKLLGMPRSSYANLESRGDNLSIEQLRHIAKALEVPLEELLTSNEIQRAVINEDAVTVLKSRVRELEEIADLTKERTNDMRENFGLLVYLEEMRIAVELKFEDVSQLNLGKEMQQLAAGHFVAMPLSGISDEQSERVRRIVLENPFVRALIRWKLLPNRTMESYKALLRQGDND